MSGGHEKSTTSGIAPANPATWPDAGQGVVRHSSAYDLSVCLRSGARVSVPFERALELAAAGKVVIHARPQGRRQLEGK